MLICLSVSHVTRDSTSAPRARQTASLATPTGSQENTQGEEACAKTRRLQIDRNIVLSTSLGLSGKHARRGHCERLGKLIGRSSHGRLERRCGLDACEPNGMHENRASSRAERARSAPHTPNQFSGLRSFPPEKLLRGRDSTTTPPRARNDPRRSISSATSAASAPLSLRPSTPARLACPPLR